MNFQMKLISASFCRFHVSHAFLAAADASAGFAYGDFDFIFDRDIIQTPENMTFCSFQVVFVWPLKAN